MHICTTEKIKQKIFDNHGSNIVLLEYCGNMSDDSKFLCNTCGNEWYASTTPIAGPRKIGCPKCANKRRGSYHKLNFEDIKKYIENEGCFLISEKYENCDKPIEIKFSCGHVGITDFYRFKQGHRCSICAHQKIGEIFKNPISKIYELLKYKNFELVEFPQGYKNRRSEIVYKCLECGSITKTKVSGLYTTKWGCDNCINKKYSNDRTGSKGSNWKGGITKLRIFVSKQIKEWKMESAKNCGFKCVISGKKFDHIHHLYAFHLIFEQAMKNLGFWGRAEKESSYTDDELKLIIEEIKELHKEYPLGVCLTKEIHRLYHQKMGKMDSTPDKWYEFLDLIKSGEIEIPT